MRQFNRNYLEERMQELNTILKSPIEIYVLGGGAMSYLGLKDSTRDIDIVLKTHNEFKLLVDALHELDYKDVVHISQPYLDMNPSAVLENPDGFRWDLFVRVICKGLLLSKGMTGRAEKWLAYDKITVYAISPEDTFIFKSVTSRERDRDDMNILFIHGLDFDIIKVEMLWQSQKLSDRAWLAFFYLGLEELRDKYDLKIPFIDEFYELACNELIDYRITDLLREKTYSIDELIRIVGESEAWVKHRIDVMIENKSIIIDKGMLKLHQ